MLSLRWGCRRLGGHHFHRLGGRRSSHTGFNHPRGHALPWRGLGRARLCTCLRAATRKPSSCLPAQLDPRSLQVRSDRSVRIGEVNVQTLERRIATGCDSAVAERIRSAQDDVAHAQAEVQGLELAHTWLTTQAGAAPGTQGLPPPPQIGPKPKPCAAQRSITSPNWPAPSAP